MRVVGLDKVDELSIHFRFSIKLDKNIIFFNCDTVVSNSVQQILERISIYLYVVIIIIIIMSLKS